MLHLLSPMIALPLWRRRVVIGLVILSGLLAAWLLIPGPIQSGASSPALFASRPALDPATLPPGLYEVMLTSRRAENSTLAEPLTQQAKLTADDGLQFDFFGWSVALSSDGNTALIGAYGNDLPNPNPSLTNAGAAYVYIRTGTSWTQQAKLTANDGRTGDSFGWSVALSGNGNTALIGAWLADLPIPNPSKEDAGAAYVFTRSGTSWTQQQKLTAADGRTGDSFGRSVALSAEGNTALVGAYLADLPIPNPTKTDAGAAYVFTRSQTIWTQQQKLTANDGTAGDYFGRSVALSAEGNTALVGAIWADPPNPNPTVTEAGAAYVFTRSGTSWMQQAKLIASDGLAYANFGYSVALSAEGNTALVGAIFADLPGKTDAGAAYVFTRSGTSWTQQQKLTAADGRTSDFFGWSVALSGNGNTALIGANLADRPIPNPTINAAGAAYLYIRSGTSWTQQQKLTTADGQASDEFGDSVALSGDGNLAMTGAAYADLPVPNPSKQAAGAVYVFAIEANVSLNSALNPALVGQSVTFTATVMPLAATGTVTFTQGTTTLGTATLTNAEAVISYTFTTAGNYSVTATYGGDATYPGAATTINQAVAGLIVSATGDNGQGDTPGSFSYVLSQTVALSTPVTITFQLGDSDTITFTGGLSFVVPANVSIDGGECGTSPRIVLNGDGVPGDGLRLQGGNTVRNIEVKNFVGKQILATGPARGNVLRCVKATD